MVTTQEHNQRKEKKSKKTKKQKEEIDQCRDSEKQKWMNRSEGLVKMCLKLLHAAFRFCSRKPCYFVVVGEFGPEVPCL